jgi:hypothetical protein
MEALPKPPRGVRFARETRSQIEKSRAQSEENPISPIFYLAQNPLDYLDALHK